MSHPPPPVRWPGPPLPPPPLLEPSDPSRAGISRAETMAVIGFTCAVIPFAGLICCMPYTLVLAVPAWVLGHMAYRVLKPPEVQTSLRGFALAAKILGIVGTVLFALSILALVLALAGALPPWWPGPRFAPSPPPTPTPAVPPGPPPAPPPPPTPSAP